MPEATLQEHSDQWVPAHREIFPFLGKKSKLDKKQTTKIELFEAGLKNEIKKTDSIQNAMTKIVRMALASEFGPSFVKAKGADAMIDTILQGIMSDNTLRKQALLIVDRFAK